MSRYIDATIQLGGEKNFRVTLQQDMGNDPEFPNFVPVNLSRRVVHFRVLGAANLQARSLIDKFIDENISEDGMIDDANAGTFFISILPKDTLQLGTGVFPIAIEIGSYNSQGKFVLDFTLTEGSRSGEFNKIYITEV